MTLSKDQGPIKLIGSEEENFYHLGLKDAHVFEESLAHFQAFMGTNFDPLDKALGLGLGFWSEYQASKNKDLMENLAAYSEGLKRPLHQVLQVFALPEILSCIDKFIPQIKGKMLGCSSLFHCHEGRIEHFRILDFPLIETYDKNAQTILFKNQRTPSIFFFTTKGLPYPGLTAMNSEGLTIALHQKYSRFYNPKGHFVFDIVYQILKNAKDEKDVIDIIKSRPSMTAWGLYITTKENNVLEIDLHGDRMKVNRFEYQENEIYYFNNIPIIDHRDFKDIIPYGLAPYCEMRKSVMEDKIKKIKKGKINRVNIFKELARPSTHKVKKAKDWAMSPATISSLEIVAMDAINGNAYQIPGHAPKIYEKELNVYENCFDKPKFSVAKARHKVMDQNYVDGHYHFSKALKAYDVHDVNQAYHHIQMSREYFEGRVEHDITHFYFLVYEFINNNNKIEWPYLLNEFNELKDKLPDYLANHNLLFIYRLERLLKHPITIHRENFTHKGLREQFQKEKNYPVLMHRTLRKVIFPRPEILDIIYL